MTSPSNDEQRMYDNEISGNPTVNETQVRRAGRSLDDNRAAEALRDGDIAGAGSVQNGQTAEERGEAERNHDRDNADTSAQMTPSARNAAESKSRTGKTQSQRTGAQ